MKMLPDMSEINVGTDGIIKQLTKIYPIKAIMALDKVPFRG